jgi:hypothetical protein
MLTYQHFRTSDYLTSVGGNRLPVVLRMEWPLDDATTPQDLQNHFQQTVQLFMRGLDTQALVARVGRPLD